MFFEQLRSTDGTGTLSYLLADSTTKRAAVIDPNIEDMEHIVHAFSTHGLSLVHVIDTHTHADHVSAAGALKERFGATLVMHENTKHKWKVVDEGDKFGIGDTLRANAAFEVDRYVNDGDIIPLDGLELELLFTPGHTDNHVAVRHQEMLFTGDLLLIGQAGRSDLPGGNAGDQYESLTKKIIPLPDNTKIFPGHDYDGNTFAYLGKEKSENPFLKQRTKAEYISFVEEFFPPLAESIDGGKMTLQCGAKRVASPTDGWTNISPRQLAERLRTNPHPFLLDVREPFELTAFGAIPGVKNISIRQLKSRLDELPTDKNAEIIAICQSGSRSAEAAHVLHAQGFGRVRNLTGGTSAWVQHGNPVERPQPNGVRQ